LDLRVNRISDDGFKLIIKSTMLNNVRDLKLDVNKVTAGGAVQLSHLCNIPKLKKLKVRGNDFGEKGASFIATTMALRGLVHLNLSRNDISDVGV